MAENDNNKVNYFTREGATRITAENLAEVRRQLRTKTTAAARSQENLVEAAAYATYGAKQVDAEWTVAKWADAVNSGKRTAVYIWERMALCLMELGIEAKTPQWTALVGKSAATNAPVTYVLDGKGRDGKGKKGEFTPTREDLDWALGVLYLMDDNGNPIPEQKRKAAEIRKSIAESRGETVADETGDGADDANGGGDETNPRSIGARCKASAEYLAGFMSELTDEQFAEIDTVLVAVFKQAKARKDAAKAAAVDAA